MSTLHESFNYLFQTKLDSWTPLRASLHQFFNDHEIALLDRSNRTFLSSMRTIVILSFENRFALLGGLGAVMRTFPAFLQKQGERVFLLTPLHRGCSAVKKAIDKGELVQRFTGHEVRICNYSCTVNCFEEANAVIPTYHVEITGRFLAGENPYGYVDQEDLLFDSLAFCAVAPSVVAHLGHTEHVLFHAHDWETAPIAIFARCAVISGLFQQVRTLLTLNNSFDAPFPDHLKMRFFNRLFSGCTVLQSMLPFFHGPLTTVSTPYAHELRHDPLQRGFFADHLQRQFAMNPPIGIENGMFGEPSVPFSVEEMAAARKGNYHPLLTKKRSWRTSIIDLIHREKSPHSFGTFTPDRLDDPSVPIFLMSGRLDLMQKGFDTVFHAFKRVKPGSAMLFFTPTPCNDKEDLSFFTEIADECGGNIIIWPFFISSRKYRMLLQGASYLLMPSF